MLTLGEKNMSTESQNQTTPKLKPLNRRQALKVKRNRIRGRVNALKSELGQLEPLLSKIEQQLIEMNPKAN
jgi:hypothetical protein